MKWRGFLIESYSFVYPRGWREHFKFIIKLLPAYLKYRREFKK